MKKQELIHLHGLLAEVRERYENRGGNDPDLSAYESTGVSPTSIHRSKTAHKEAVFELATGLAQEMSDEEQHVTASAD